MKTIFSLLYRQDSFVIYFLAWIACWIPLEIQAIESRSIEKLIEDAQTEGQKKQRLHKEQEIMAQGRAHFERFCIHCHGEHGKGNGLASHYLNPQPRDFKPGIFKLHSTQTNSPPRDEDLYETIANGIPGTAMPSWGSVLSDETIKALVVYIKSFSNRFDVEIPDYPINIGPEPALDDLSLQKGKELYRQMRCSRCHGKNGEKTGPLEGIQKDAWGKTSWVFDLRKSELYKAGAEGSKIYKTLATGIDGTPMPPYDYLSNLERWHLVHYLQTFFNNDPVKLAPGSLQLTAFKTNERLTENPSDPIWSNAKPKAIRLNVLKFRPRPIKEIEVKILYNASQIAFRLQWEDASPDNVTHTKTTFLDETAIQFSLDADTIFDGPFLGMGQPKKPVYIWHWKADAHQEVVGKTFDASSDIYKILNPFNESPVEELNARGFGALTVQLQENQQLAGKGKWENGMWSVVFLRARETPSRFDVQFGNHKNVLLAFGIWDGASGDKSANKLVTFWQTLTLQ